MKSPENKDIVMVERTRFNLTDLNVAAQIERMKAARPHVIIVWTVGTPFATVLKGLVQGGVDLPIATSPGNMTYAQMRQYADFLPKELPTVRPYSRTPARWGSRALCRSQRPRPTRSGRPPDWLKSKNPACEAVRREAEEDWGQ